MKKFLVSTLLVFIIAMCLTSCSDKKTSSTDADDKTNTPKAESILTKWDAPYQYEDLSEYIIVEESDYLKVPYKAITYEITDEDIQNEIQKLLDEHAIHTEVTDREVAKGDYINIDYTGYLDGVAFEGGSYKGDEFVLGEGGFIPGFEEGIYGHKAGESFTIDVTFPDDYGSETLDGKAVKFDIVLNSVMEISYPNLTDDFVKENTSYETVNAYYTAINEALLKKSEASAKVAQKNQVFATVCENVEFVKCPETEYNDYRNAFVNEYEEYAETYQMPFEEFIVELGSSVEEFNKYADQYATEAVNMELAFFAIADRIGLLEQLTMDEYDEYLVNIAAEYMQTPEEFISMYGEDAVYRSLVWDRVMDFVLENAVLTE